MRTTPAEGMNDYLPRETEIRDRLMEQIVKSYRSYGFTKITTPIVESIENLDNSDGGDNLKLIFRVLKRGQKLENALQSGDPGELCDLGLRYDLTLPLVRYYSNNRAKLPDPFKCIQIDRAYRAERPQKGRSREFVQCDIDVIGSDSLDSEVELITVTAETLLSIGISDFTVRINDRRALRAIIESAGFDPADADSVCITIDKLDKIAADGVRAELLEKGFARNAVEALMSILADGVTADDLEKYADPAVAEGVKYVIGKSTELADGKYGIKYDVTLVRGQGYYTGAVFEIESPAFGGTIAGGGRYDGLIGRFTGENVPAVGFSIGFERIFSILAGGEAGGGRKKIALLYDEGQIAEALKFSASLRDGADVTLVKKKKKLGKQFGQLEAQGFSEARFLGEPDNVKVLGQNQ